jgi:hypothetical protein
MFCVVNVSQQVSTRCILAVYLGQLAATVFSVDARLQALKQLVVLRTVTFSTPDKLASCGALSVRCWSVACSLHSLPSWMASWVRS